MIDALFATDSRADYFAGGMLCVNEMLRRGDSTCEFPSGGAQLERPSEGEVRLHVQGFAGLKQFVLAAAWTDGHEVQSDLPDVVGPAAGTYTLGNCAGATNFQLVPWPGRGVRIEDVIQLGHAGWVQKRYVVQTLLGANGAPVVGLRPGAVIFPRRSGPFAPCHARLTRRGWEVNRDSCPPFATPPKVLDPEPIIPAWGVYGSCDHERGSGVASGSRRRQLMSV